MLREPFSAYVNMVDIGDVGVEEWYATGRQGSRRTTGELCLIVGLREPLPQDLEIPQTYGELKVYTEVIGEITPHS